MGVLKKIGIAVGSVSEGMEVAQLRRVWIVMRLPSDLFEGNSMGLILEARSSTSTLPLGL